MAGVVGSAGIDSKMVPVDAGQAQVPGPGSMASDRDEGRRLVWQLHVGSGGIFAVVHGRIDRVNFFLEKLEDVNGFSWLQRTRCCERLVRIEKAIPLGVFARPVADGRTRTVKVSSEAVDLAVCHAHTGLEPEGMLLGGDNAAVGQGQSDGIAEIAMLGVFEA